MDNIIPKDRSATIIKLISYVCIIIFTLLCLFPFLLMLTSSLMKESEIAREGFKLIPNEFTLNSYKFLLDNPRKIILAYQTTLTITVIGTVTGLFLMTMAGYVLNRQSFRYRNAVSFFIYFTTLFSGGLVPTYLVMVRTLHLKDSIWAMILPGVASAWSIFLMRNFMKSIPDSLYEAATIDGAGDFRTYWQICLPLSIPAIATIGLFSALGFWNEWYNASLYIDTVDKYPLQYYLQKMVNSADISLLISQGMTIDAKELPTQSVKMSTAVLATGPIILLYPFVQRYFIAGLTVGSVKG